ncbi:hypothetical protein LRK24_10875 [Rhodanobacter denitrificans]|nr:hypothetical protein [Rhodanobacter denitrificans]UJM92145.1 hypothetical protein LRK24_10875 [Rhodanobacter denitrificans]
MMHKLFSCGLCALLLSASLKVTASAQNAPLVLQRDGRTISLEPYAPNILRVTFSVDRAAVMNPPGYGFEAEPSAQGWTHTRDAAGGDVFRSEKMVVRVAPGELAPDELPQRMPLDALNRRLREKYFGWWKDPHTFSDALRITDAAGKTLLSMRTWTMVPEATQADAGTKSFRVAATFESPANEHYYGLGHRTQPTGSASFAHGLGTAERSDQRGTGRDDYAARFLHGLAQCRFGSPGRARGV